eukprot:scaffold268672_cov14-Prasinocladus_malaysianus.AAC.1
MKDLTDVARPGKPIRIYIVSCTPVALGHTCVGPHASFTGHGSSCLPRHSDYFVLDYSALGHENLSAANHCLAESLLDGVPTQQHDIWKKPEFTMPIMC